MIGNQEENDALKKVTRRHFLTESAVGMGAIALGTLMGSCGIGRGAAPLSLSAVTDPMMPKPLIFREGPACDLSAHGRGALAVRTFRLQAGTSKT